MLVSGRVKTVTYCPKNWGDCPKNWGDERFQVERKFPSQNPNSMNIYSMIQWENKWMAPTNWVRKLTSSITSLSKPLKFDISLSLVSIDAYKSKTIKMDQKTIESRPTGGEGRVHRETAGYVVFFVKIGKLQQFLQEG